MIADLDIIVGCLLLAIGAVGWLGPLVRRH